MFLNRRITIFTKPFCKFVDKESAPLRMVPGSQALKATVEF